MHTRNPPKSTNLRGSPKKDNIFVIAIFIAVVGLYSSTIFATGAPVSLGQWSASSGTINDTACLDVGVSCDLIFQDDGLRYEYLETADGTFSRMIVTDPGVTGDVTTLPFAIENFTPFLERAGSSDAFEFPNGDIAQGLASQQVIRDSELEFTADIQRGFARDVRVAGLTTEEQAANAWGTKLVQTNTGGDVTNGFSALVYNEVNSLPAAMPDSDVVRGRAVDVWQTVSIAGTGEKQGFDHRTREGYKGWHWFLCCTDSLTKGGSVTLDSGTVSWSAGELVDATWVGSDIAGLFGYETVMSPGGSATETSIDAVGPFDWQALSSDDMNWPLDPWLSPADPSRTSPPGL